MAEISQIKLPSGTTYNFKDTTSRNKISNLTGGGRNILTNSNLMIDWNTATYASITDGIASITGSSSNWRGCLNTSKFDASIYNGSEYIISFDYKTIADIALHLVAAGTNQTIKSNSWSRTKYSGGLLSPSTLPSTDGEWKRFVCPSVALPLSKLSGGSGDVVSGYLQFYNRTDNVVLQIRHIKFEYGNIPTDWTYAPEDLITVNESNSQLIIL